MSRSIKRVEKPRILFHFVALGMSSTKSSRACRNSLAFPCTPRIPLNCDAAILKDAAEVNPAITGYEKNSTRKPKIIKILFQYKVPAGIQIIYLK